MGSRFRRHTGLRGMESLGPAPHFVTQRQDHFDGSNIATWQQAFYVNDSFWTPGSDAPVFLCVGGEGPPLDGTAVVRSVHCNVAVEMLPETHALMFALEHRYYGCWNASACPVANLSAPGALRFHSSRQALADIAGFVEYAAGAYGLAARNKWVTWGGSYPGMLAGWARLKFPHLVHAAVSSSAPVRAELDMRGYNDVTAAAYAVSHERVGGSPACRDAIARGHAQIGVMFGTADGRAALATDFGGEADAYSSLEQQRDFAGEGVADFPAQANDPTCEEPMCNIAHICTAMTNSSIGDEVKRLAFVRKMQSSGRSWELLTTRDSRVEPAPGYDGGLLWGWQTCAEFGFYQTCETGSACFYTQGLSDLESEMSFCAAQFGISKDAVAENIRYSNTYYGADRPEGTRVLYVNGEVDPWRANSITTQFSTRLPVLSVDGASHHAWTHPSDPSDQVSVQQARVEIRRTVQQFLAEPRDADSVLVV